MYGDVIGEGGGGTRAIAPPVVQVGSAASGSRRTSMGSAMWRYGVGELLDEGRGEVVRRRAPQAVEELLQLDVRQQPDEVCHHRAERAEGFDHVRTLRRIAGPADGDGGDLLEVPLTAGRVPVARC
jgi:hypothetical protein